MPTAHKLRLLSVITNDKQNHNLSNHPHTHNPQLYICKLWKFNFSIKPFYTRSRYWYVYSIFWRQLWYGGDPLSHYIGFGLHIRLTSFVCDLFLCWIYHTPKYQRRNTFPSGLEKIWYLSYATSTTKRIYPSDLDLHAFNAENPRKGR